MPPKSIKRISADQTLKICSQQVLLDLGQCVKELVENSLDAGSKQIEVRLLNYGLDGVECVDNGHGIPSSQQSIVTQRHTTSKISRYEDLESVETFGFRGEALSSLCALAKVSIVTACDPPVGHKLVFDQNGEIVESVPMARERGTTVRVTDLFYMLPVRFKDFQKNAKRDYYKCVQLLQEYALISTGVRLSIVHVVKGSRQVVFSTPGSALMKDNITAVMGSKVISKLMPIDISISLPAGSDEAVETPKNARISGFVSQPTEGYGRPSADKQYLFINNRPCQLPKIARKVNEVYRTFNFAQLPCFVMILTMPPGTFDVNVTPDKKTILLHDEAEIVEKFGDELTSVFKDGKESYDLVSVCSQKSLPVQSQISNTFVSHTKVSRKLNVEIGEQDSMHSQKLQRVEIDLVEDEVRTSKSSPNPKSRLVQVNESATKKVSEVIVLDAVEPADSASECCSRSPSPIISLPEIPLRIAAHPINVPGDAPKHCFKYDMESIRSALNTKSKSKTRALSSSVSLQAPALEDPEAENILRRVIKRHDFPRMQVIGQFNLGFILCKLPSGTDGEWDIFVVDQHASDEIYLFHKYQNESVIETQKLVCAKVLELSADQLLLAAENEAFFKKNGFEFDVVASASTKRVLRLTSLPVLYGKVLGVADFEELLSALEMDPTRKVRCAKVRAVFASKGMTRVFNIIMDIKRDSLSICVDDWRCTWKDRYAEDCGSLGRYRATVELSTWQTDYALVA
eukprot:Partr_v1_DN28705_c1_g1_i1_m62231 putative PMS2 postmeiotic segregation increased 2 (S. cerevisiae)